MRRAMAEAEVGDDGTGEDPTVIALEEAFAARLGKPAALLVPSGTMANQIALRLLGQPGTAVVVGRSQHIVAFENGAAAMNASVQWHLVDDSRHASRGRSAVGCGWGPAPSARDERGVHREHTHGELGDPLVARRPRGHFRVGSAGASRRRAVVQRGGGDRRCRVGLCRRGDHGDVLPLEGIGRADRVVARGPGRSHRAGEGRAQALRRGHAPGGCHRGAGSRRAERQRRASGRGSRAGEIARRGGRDPVAGGARPRFRAHQPGRVPMRRHRRACSVISPTRVCSRAPSRRASSDWSRTSTSTTTASASPRRPSRAPRSRTLGASGSYGPRNARNQRARQSGRLLALGEDLAPLTHRAQHEHGDHGGADRGDDGADQRADGRGGAAVARALQVDEAVADQSAAQPADEDRDEREHARAEDGRAEREPELSTAPGSFTTSIVGSAPPCAPSSCSPPTTRPRTSPRCSPSRGPPCPTRRSSSSTTAAPTAPPTLAEELGTRAGPDRTCCAARQGGAGLGVPRRLSRGARPSGLDVLIEMDSDLSHDPAALPSLARRDRRRRRSRHRVAVCPRWLHPELAPAPAPSLAVGQPVRGRGAGLGVHDCHRGLPGLPSDLAEQRSISTRCAPTATASRSR